MAGFLGAGALATALAGAQRRRAEGQQVAWDRGMEERRLEESVLQRELARKLQERQFGLAERQFQESAADRDLAREQAGTLSRERMMSAALAAQEAREARAAEREQDQQFRAGEAEKQREFMAAQGEANRNNMRQLRAMTGAQPPRERAPTEMMMRARAFLPGAEAAAERLLAIPEDQFNVGMGSYLLSKAGVGGNLFKSGDYRAIETNMKGMLARVLPITSGQALTPSEIEIQASAMLPKPGDDAATIRAKREQIVLTMRALRTLSGDEGGGAAPPVPAPQGGRPRPPLNSFPGHSR